jgi:NhaP-type Na+/H+ or K+/H+ antiporter
VDFQHVWVLALSLGGAAALAAFTAPKLITALSPQRRRLLFALAAVLAFCTASLVGVTGIFFVLFSGYCGTRATASPSGGSSSGCLCSLQPSCSVA